MCSVSLTTPHGHAWPWWWITTIIGERVARELNEIAQGRGYPHLVVSDNGTEFTSNAMRRRPYDHGVNRHYIPPGKPLENGSLERYIIIKGFIVVQVVLDLFYLLSPSTTLFPSGKFEIKSIPHHSGPLRYSAVLTLCRVILRYLNLVRRLRNQ